MQPVRPPPALLCFCGAWYNVLLDSASGEVVLQRVMEVMDGVSAATCAVDTTTTRVVGGAAEGEVAAAVAEVPAVCVGETFSALLL